jgi:hypothetical protein
MSWSKVFSNPHRVREIPLPGGPSPEEREALQAVHASLRADKAQALRYSCSIEQVRRIGDELENRLAIRCNRFGTT